MLQQRSIEHKRASAHLHSLLLQGALTSQWLLSRQALAAGRPDGAYPALRVEVH